MSIYLFFTQGFYFMLTGMQHTVFTQQFFAASNYHGF